MLLFFAFAVFFLTGFWFTICNFQSDSVIWTADGGFRCYGEPAPSRSPFHVDIGAEGDGVTPIGTVTLPEPQLPTQQPSSAPILPTESPPPAPPTGPPTLAPTYPPGEAPTSLPTPPLPLLHAMAHRLQMPALVEFGQSFDIPPLKSLPIVDYEFLALHFNQALNRSEWRSEPNCSNPVEHTRPCHACPCSAYNSIGDHPRNSQFKVIIVVDNMGYSDARLSDFVRLPFALPKHYFILNRCD